MYQPPTKWSKLKWQVGDWVNKKNHAAKKVVEKYLRKALLLPRDDEYDYFERRGDFFVVNKEKLDARIQNSHIRFHGKPRRGHYLDEALRFFFYKWREPISGFKRWCRSKLEWYLFFKARDIEWKTHHYIHRVGTDQIDGYFSYTVWGIKCRRTFDLCGAAAVKNDTLEWNAKTGKLKSGTSYIDLNKYGSWGFPTLMVSTKKVMTKDINKILNKWYSDQVDWKYRHWTWQGDRPNITTPDLKFMEDLCDTCGLDAYGCQGHYAEKTEDHAGDFT